MSKNKGETLYEKTMRRLKNNPIIVAILVIGAIAVGLSQGLDIFNKLKESLFPATAQITEVHITIQPYKVPQGYSGSPILRSPALDNANNLNEITEAIITQITEAVQPGKATEHQSTLKIDGKILHSDKPVNGEITVIEPLSPTPIQQDVRVYIKNIVEGDDLSTRFGDNAVFDPNCSCIHLDLSAPESGYQDQSLDIYKFRDGYSFNKQVQVTTMDIVFPIVPVVVLIEMPQGNGATEQDIKVTQAGLYSALREKIQENTRLTLSSFKTQDELKAAIDAEIAKIPIGVGKDNYIFQNRVDFIITVNFIMK